MNERVKLILFYRNRTTATHVVGSIEQAQNMFDVSGAIWLRVIRSR